jgi:sigma-B regulation protein RsbU (phosphoserine phosphatase)
MADRISLFKEEVLDLYSEMNLGALLEKITASIKATMGSEEASIFIYDPEKEELMFETATGEKEKELKQMILKKGQGVAGWIAEQRQGVIINDCQRDPRYTSTVDQKTLFHTRSLLGVPVQMDGRVLGVLEAVNKKRGKFSSDDLQVLEQMAGFMAIPLHNAVLIRQMLEKEKMEKELQIARDIQQSFLLQQPLNFPGLDIAFLNIPSSKVGGDYYEIIALNDREIIFSINDVSGHGVPASLLMAIFRSNFVFQIRQGGDISATISHLNRLIAETTEPNLFVTSFTAKLDCEAGILSYINAGHPPLLVVRGTELLPLAAGGMVVGMFADVEYPVSRFAMQPGDVLIFYTDGVIEAENEKEEEYSLQRLGTAVVSRRDLSAAAMQTALIEDLKNFCRRRDFSDDVTLMVVKYLGC